MANKIKWDHAALEAALDAFMPECVQMAEQIKARADATLPKGAAPFNVGTGTGPSKRYKQRPGGRHYAVVSANAPSTKAHVARTNALLKAAG